MIILQSNSINFDEKFKKKLQVKSKCGHSILVDTVSSWTRYNGVDTVMLNNLHILPHKNLQLPMQSVSITTSVVS